MIVLKFGGTSVQNADAMRRVIGITLAARNRKPLVVASACAGVTNLLTELADVASVNNRERVDAICAELTERHTLLCAEMTGGAAGTAEDIQEVENLCAELARFAEGICLLRECTPRSRAALLSFGERLSTSILRAGFHAQGHDAILADAREVMLTDSTYLDAGAYEEELEQRAREILLPLLDSGSIVVTQGFIGRNRGGITTTLGRGGSDLSAALLGAALGAEEIQIWTDVDGIYTSDPRIIADARTVPHMTFTEAGELAYYGAKVLHPLTILPAVKRDIPVRVLNTFSPEKRGTLLTSKDKSGFAGIRAVTLKKNMLMVSFTLRPGLKKNTFMEAVYKAIARRNLEVFAGQSGADHIGLFLDNTAATPDLCRELGDRANYTIKEISLLCACGPNMMVHGAAVVAVDSITAALLPHGILSIQQTASNVSIIAAVPKEQSEAALRAVHALIPPA